ncbi:hypothetical protein J6590_021109 [Homalodisca vitripennis]|nr:hypothetical protein J6590_021109 [Homalodisca vitripennis]
MRYYRSYGVRVIRNRAITHVGIWLQHERDMSHGGYLCKCAIRRHSARNATVYEPYYRAGLAA